MIHVILCGGAGTRLWPLSNESTPKQFLKLFDKRSLFQRIVLGNLPLCKECFCVCNADHHLIAMNQLNEIGVTPLEFILEPVSRNTAAAVAFAALSVDPETLLLITPADHLVAYDKEYTQAVEAARLQASEGKIALFGIRPTSPETGYGYIEAEGSIVSCFHEKPSLATATEYMNSEKFFWNSGMLCTSAKTIIQEMETHAPGFLLMIKSALASMEISSTRPLTKKISSAEMVEIPELSFEYAVLEKSKNLRVVPSSFYWSDLGSFDSIYSYLPKDEDGNSKLAAESCFYDSQNNLVLGGSKPIYTVSINDCVIIDTESAILITTRGKTQQVKKLVEHLKQKGTYKKPLLTTEERPWGCFSVILSENFCKVKKIVVYPGKRLSLQKHYHRSEHWTVVSGCGLVTLDDTQIFLSKNESTYIPLGMVHRIENPGKINLIFIEVQYGEYTGEDDIIRLEDDFKRV